MTTTVATSQPLVAKIFSECGRFFESLPLYFVRKIEMCRNIEEQSKNYIFNSPQKKRAGDRNVKLIYHRQVLAKMCMWQLNQEYN